MKVNLHRVDVTKQVADGVKPPAIVFPRPKTKNPDSATPVSQTVGSFWVPETMVIAGQPLAWKVTRTGDHVRVPVYAYQIQATGPEGLVFAGTELGMRALNNLMISKNFTPRHAAEWEINVFFGDSPEKLIHEQGHEQGWRYLVGLAIRTE